jgi:hypothetical protein
MPRIVQIQCSIPSAHSSRVTLAFAFHGKVEKYLTFSGLFKSLFEMTRVPESSLFHHFDAYIPLDYGYVRLIRVDYNFRVRSVMLPRVELVDFANSNLADE